MKNKTKTYGVLTKEFTVNGITFPKGKRFFLREGNMFWEGVGFEKNGNFFYGHYFGYGKNLEIPKEYFTK
jgi:hypothetical protein